MFQHLLVPLDGTPMAESAAAVAAGLAAATGARVTLLHVLEASPPAEVHGQRHLAQEGEAEEYLRDVARRLFPAEVKVATHVHPQPTAKVAQGLASHAVELAPDLMVLCAHGGVRLRDRLRGNIAQQVVRAGVAPVLLVRPPTGGAAEGGEAASGGAPTGAAAWPFHSILVPLDGQPGHQRGLDLAAEFARTCEAPLLLLTVVRTEGVVRGGQLPTAGLLPGATQAMIEINEAQAAKYLEGLVADLSAGGLKAAARVVRGDPAREIIREAKEARADLVALGTHGHAGTEAFWSGTVTPKLLRRMAASFLLVPVAEEPVANPGT
jgi:nucleotide-binding universal stress UspA family protein